MRVKDFKEKALIEIRDNPGMTRMEWFNSCISENDDRDKLWHIFKFQVALPLIIGGQVKSKEDQFFPL